MARTPKAPLPVPARRGRKPKTAEPIALAAAPDDDIEAVEAAAATVKLGKKPVRGKPGPKPKLRPEAAMPALPEEDVRQPAMNLDQLDTTVQQASDHDDETIAEMAYPVSADADGTTPSSNTGVDDAVPTPGQEGCNPSKPAARWDQATDTVQFDWPEIERTAAQGGPNQVMAKLLVAARAEGANSRWPL